MTTKEVLDFFEGIVEMSGYEPEQIIKLCELVSKIAGKVRDKATDEWHYPAMGELPEDNSVVLITCFEGGILKSFEWAIFRKCCGPTKGMFELCEKLDTAYKAENVYAWRVIKYPEPKEDVSNLIV